MLSLDMASVLLDGQFSDIKRAHDKVQSSKFKVQSLKDEIE